MTRTTSRAGIGHRNARRASRATSLPRRRGSRAARALALRCALGLVLALAGCAGTPPPEEAEAARPRHPFPRWVAALETGRTERASVLEVFGEPEEIEAQGQGAQTWRYAYPEILWAPSDPDRPEIAADGTPRPRTPSTWERVRTGARKTGRFLDGLLFYPAARVDHAAARSLPATVHHLELAFDVEGRLLRYRYAPQSEQVVVRRDR